MLALDAREVDRKFVQAWNRGDLVAACELYADDAVYVSAKSGLLYGKEEILERYKRDYPDPSTMGTLKTTLMYSIVEGTMGSALWRWTVDLQNETRLEGYNLEVYKKRKGQILIAQDVTVTLSP
jgi:ketosteroid isomerase-like protein